MVQLPCELGFFSLFFLHCFPFCSPLGFSARARVRVFEVISSASILLEVQTTTDAKKCSMLRILVLFGAGPPLTENINK